MKYNELKLNIYNILSQYNFVLNLYDDNGKIQSKINEISYIYILNENIIIKFENDKEIIVYKSDTELKSPFIEIFKEIRKQAIMNGLHLSMKVFKKTEKNDIINIIKENSKKNNKIIKVEESLNKVFKTINSMKKYKTLNEEFGFRIDLLVNKSKLFNICKQQIKECIYKFSDKFLDNVFMSVDKKSFLENVKKENLSLIETKQLIINSNKINKILKLFENKYKKLNLNFTQDEIYSIIKNNKK